ncbi:hypothetical protein CONPUDRAFT_73295 [Coniophora puteana RWD-64-598 SS2]|uniref:Uncharacterized protein n=1 Tax=Coniophora puteana (strain RWD-64-598) TaxID=741705 RepID=A0A5M3MR01_CONPW|nr:uncharacterized protein CONPUDRAFT_73295 [Coniophora puteana RWD-64-598 SS2]EIW81618.1 hypothetical protein CONPUDRAFT_73295 [Coniophora puteana RWD-64-598 SS2]
MSLPRDARRLSPHIPDSVASVSDGTDAPSPPPSPPPPPAPTPNWDLPRLDHDYIVNLNCGHIGAAVAGNGTAREIVDACITTCCVRLVAEEVTTLLFKDRREVQFQDMIQVAVNYSLRSIYQNEEFQRFFRGYAREEIRQQLGDAAVIQPHHQSFIRVPAASANSARDQPATSASTACDNVPTGNQRAAVASPSPGPDRTPSRSSTAASPSLARGDATPRASTTASSSTSRDDAIPREPSSNVAQVYRTRRYGSIDPNREGLGVIPLDGVVNRNLDAETHGLVFRLPRRFAILQDNTEVMYYTPETGTGAPFYWVPYGRAIGVFTSKFLSLWAGDPEAEAYQVGSLEQAFVGLENALFERRFRILR